MTIKDVELVVHRFYPDLPVYDSFLPLTRPATKRFQRTISATVELERSMNEFPPEKPRYLSDIRHVCFNPWLLEMPDNIVLDTVYHELLHVQMFLNGENPVDGDAPFELRRQQLGLNPDYMNQMIREHFTQRSYEQAFEPGVVKEGSWIDEWFYG